MKEYLSGVAFTIAFLALHEGTLLLGINAGLIILTSLILLYGIPMVILEAQRPTAASERSPTAA